MAHNILRDQEIIHSEISQSLFNISHFLKEMIANKAAMSEVDMTEGLERIQAQADSLLSSLDASTHPQPDELKPIPGSKLSSFLSNLTS